MKPSPRKSTVTRIRPARAPRGVSTAEWEARCELAAAFRMNRLERACRFQLAALTGGAEANPIPNEIVDYTAQQGRESSRTGRGAGGKLLRAALKRRLDREDPGYRM